MIFLMLGKLRMSGSNEYLLGTLVIPVVPPAPARLELLVSNESTNSPAEFVEVTTIRGTNLVMSEEGGGDIHWKEVVTPGESNLSFAALILPGAILPRNGRSLPILIFENAKDFIDRHLMFKISLEAKDMDKSFLVFWISFQNSTNEMPYLVPPPNSSLKTDSQ